MDLAELACRSGVSPQTLARWLDLPSPPDSTIARCAVLLGWEDDYIAQSTVYTGWTGSPELCLKLGAAALGKVGTGQLNDVEAETLAQMMAAAHMGSAAAAVVKSMDIPPSAQRMALAMAAKHGTFTRWVPMVKPEALPPCDSNVALDTLAWDWHCDATAPALKHVLANDEQELTWVPAVVEKAFHDLAGQIWPACYAAVDALTWAQHAHDQGVDQVLPVVRGKTVLELGAGTGLASLVMAGTLQPAAVIVTDMAVALPRMQAIVSAHGQLHGKESVPMQAQVLEWKAAARAIEQHCQLLHLGSAAQPTALPEKLQQLLTAEIIVAADVTYSPDLVDALLNLLQAIQAGKAALGLPSTQALLVASERSPDTQVYLDEQLERVHEEHACLDVQNVTEAAADLVQHPILLQVRTSNVHVATPVRLYTIDIHGSP